MAKVYTDSMAAKAGFVEIQDSTTSEVLYKYQAPLAALRRVDYGDNREYTVLPGDTWQNIALRYLGSAELWWLIAEFNRVLDPFEEFYPGKRLIIPLASRVRLANLQRL